MSTPPIFKFKNTKTKITASNTAQMVYGVIAYNGQGNSLDSGINASDVSAVILTVQVSNLLASNVLITVSIVNASNTRVLVNDYPLIPYNAFDPLSGNLVMTSGDQLMVECSVANGCDVVVSLLEIANATAN
jgi:hypothetical protein